MKFIILKKDKDSTIARNDSVFPVNNFFVVLTLVSSLANSFGIFFPTISHSGNVIEMCFFVMFSTLLAAFSWICPYISRHLLSLNPLQARCRRYSRGER